MKTLLFIFCLLFPFLSYGQIPAQSEFTVNGTTYKRTDIAGRISIANGQNFTRTTWNNIPSNTDVPDDCVFGLKGMINYQVVKDAVYSVFPLTRRQQLINDEFGVVFFIKPMTGKIEEMRFSVSGNTQITPQEIYQLEQALKGKLMPQRPWCGAVVFLVFPFSFDFKDHQN